MLGLWGRFCPPDLVRQQRRASAQARRWVEAELRKELQVGRYDVLVHLGPLSLAQVDWFRRVGVVVSA